MPATPTAISQVTESTTVQDVDLPSTDCVALVSPKIREIVTDNAIIKVTKLNNRACNLSALLDTGSPVSFIDSSTYNEYFKDKGSKITSHVTYKAINGLPIEIIDVVNSSIGLEPFSDLSASIQLNVLSNRATSTNIIIGLDFIKKHNITVILNPSNEESGNKLQLLSEVASAEVIDNPIDKIKFSLSDITIDFDQTAKEKLISVIQEVENSDIPRVDDDHSVKINLKDESVYAFAPRRFAKTV